MITKRLKDVGFKYNEGYDYPLVIKYRKKPYDNVPLTDKELLALINFAVKHILTRKQLRSLEVEIDKRVKELIRKTPVWCKKEDIR